MLTLNEKKSLYVVVIGFYLRHIKEYFTLATVNTQSVCLIYYT